MKRFAWFLAVLLAASSLVAVSGREATAAPTPCTITFGTANGGTIPPRVGNDPFGFTFVDIQVPDTRTVADVDFYMDVSVPEASQVGFRLINPEAVKAGALEPFSVLQAPSSGPLNASYTLDDEATAT